MFFRMYVRWNLRNVPWWLGLKLNFFTAESVVFCLFEDVFGVNIYSESVEELCLRLDLLDCWLRYLLCGIWVCALRLSFSMSLACVGLICRVIELDMKVLLWDFTMDVFGFPAERLLVRLWMFGIEFTEDDAMLPFYDVTIPCVEFVPVLGHSDDLACEFYCSFFVFFDFNSNLFNISKY